jgi:hypothetical protein
VPVLIFDRDVDGKIDHVSLTWTNPASKKPLLLVLRRKALLDFSLENLTFLTRKSQLSRSVMSASVYRCMKRQLTTTIVFFPNMV